MTPKELVARGYRVTSRAYGLLSRVDRPDWKEYLLAKGMSPKLADGELADHYRRVYSQDTVTIGRGAARLLPTSDHDPVGFVE